MITKPLLIDGSVLEGGGQLLRNAVSISSILGKPISIENIRAGRSTPGLKAQHIAGINLVANICDAKIIPSPLLKQTSSLEFIPRQRQLGGSHLADPDTAGSITLLLQVALPPLLFPHNHGTRAEDASVTTKLKLRGGTNAIQAPQIDYTTQIFLPFLKRHWGIEIGSNVQKRGYWPKGGGEVQVTVSSLTGRLQPITLTERGKVIKINGYSYAAGLPAHIAKSMASAAQSHLVEHSEVLGYPESSISIHSRRESPAIAVASGSGIVLWAETETGCIIGGSAIGRKGTDPLNVGREAAEELRRNLEHGGCVDEYLQDQLIIFLALASGTSTIVTGPLTLHTKTALWLAELLTPAKFIVAEEGNGRMKITCHGMAFPDNLS